MTDTDTTTTPPPADPYDAIPDSLRFDLDETPPDQPTVQFALGGNILTATRPLQYTMLMLGSAMSGLSDGPDRAYAIMTFCHDAFDGTTREIVKNLSSEALFDVIRSLCEHWDLDTSEWEKEQANNRAERRATAKKTKRR